MNISTLKRVNPFILWVITFLALLTAFECKAQINLDSMLTACYPFSGNASDLSGNNHNGTVYGAALTYDRFGNANSAYHFDGANSYIEIQHFDSLVPNDEVSISFWCIVYSGINNHAQFQLQPDDNADRFCVSVHYSHNSVPSTFWDYGDILGTGRLDTINIPYASQWEHYVFVSSATQNVMMEYRNGVLLKSENHHGTVTNKLRKLWIGKGSTLKCVNGNIDDVRFYNRIINSAEVAALYNNSHSCSNQGDTDTVHSIHELSIYPDPNAGIFTIELPGSNHQQLELTIFNSLGQIVYGSIVIEKPAQKTTVDLLSTAGGVYMLHLSLDGQSYREKIIVQR